MASNVTSTAIASSLNSGLSLAIAIPSGLSIIGILLVFYVYVAVFHKLNQYSYPKVLYRMVVYMSLASLLLVIAGIGISYDLSERICHPFWVFLRESSFISSIFWAGYYAYSLKEIITNNYTVRIIDIEKQGLIVAFVVPVLISGFFILHGYEEGVGISCYVTVEGQQPLIKYVALFGVLLPICGVFVFTTYCYMQIGLNLWASASYEGELLKIWKELMLFPIALLICCLFPVLNTIFVIFFNQRIPTLILLHHISQQSTGFVNALAYGLKYASFKYFKRQLKSVKRAFQSICSTNQDSERKSTYQMFELHERLIYRNTIVV